MNIGENIKRIRQWKGIPQKTICDSTGITQGTLSKIESGSDFLWSKLVSISGALGINVQDVVCFDAAKFTFHLSGDKAKGMVINQNNQDIIQLLRDENVYLRKMLETAIIKQKK